MVGGVTVLVVGVGKSLVEVEVGNEVEKNLVEVEVGNVGNILVEKGKKRVEVDVGKILVEVGKGRMEVEVGNEVKLEGSTDKIDQQ